MRAANNRAVPAPVADDARDRTRCHDDAVGRGRRSGSSVRWHQEANRRRLRRGWALTCLLLCLPAFVGAVTAQRQNAPLPTLTAPVNDFAGVVDASSAAELDRLIRALQAASGDVLTVVTVQSIAPYADVREYAVTLFANGGRGIGQKGEDNGALIVLAVAERSVWIEVGYGLEPFITDGFAGETTRQFMVPAFRQGQYGAGLLAGAQRLAGRIAEARHVTLTGVEAPRARQRAAPQFSVSWIVIIFIIFAILSRMGGGGPRRGMRRRGGWISGVGPFGGGFGGRRLWRRRVRRRRVRRRVRWLWRRPQRRRWRRRQLVRRCRGAAPAA